MTQRPPTLQVRWDLVDALREQRGLVDESDFVAALPVSRATTQRVLQGKQTPGASFIAALCIALECTPAAVCEAKVRVA